jgi:hypothetical protein
VQQYGFVTYIVLVFVDVTQDIASKGLGMIYEISSSQQKDSLVAELVETLTTGKRSVEMKYYMNDVVTHTTVK